MTVTIEDAPSPARERADLLRSLSIAPYVRTVPDGDRVLLRSTLDGRTFGVLDTDTNVLTLGSRARFDAWDAGCRAAAVTLLRQLVRAQLYRGQLGAATP